MNHAKPHLVIIMADQLRADALGAYTPNINRLQAESVDFTRAYCASPLCVPTRGAFFTGHYPNETGSIINPWEKLDAEHGQVRPGTPHLYELLERDWDTWHTGKQHLKFDQPLEERAENLVHWRSLEQGYGPYLKEHGKRKPGSGARYKGILPELVSGRTTKVRQYSLPTTGCYDDGFDYFFDGYITRTSLEAIHERDRSKPFALSAMFLAPHPPLEIPEPWYSRIKPEDIELPDNVGRWGSNQSPLQLYNLPGVFGSRYSRDDWAGIWPVYLGLVSLLDDCVGMLIDSLKQEGLYDDALIVFTSDHGEMLGSHRLWQKNCMYEESARTPLMIKLPKGADAAITRSDALVSAIDVMPTICEAVGIPIPADVSGRSLMPIIRGESGGRERVFIQYDGNGARGNFQRCVLEGNWKLIVDIFKDELFLELYDLAKDPQEMTNQAFEPEQAGRVESMLQAVRTHMRQTDDLLSIPDDAYPAFIERYTPFMVQ